MLISNKQGIITMANNQAENLLGYPANQLIGMSIEALVPERFRESHPKLREAFEASAINRTMGFERTTIALRKDASEVNIEITLSPIQTEHGLFFASALRDVTERKRAEEASQVASQYSRSLIEASLDPLVTISAEGKITDVNLATETVTGVDRTSLISSDFADYFTDPDQAREGYQLVFSQGYVMDYPLAIRHVSGKITDVLYNANVYKDSDGKVLGVFAAARDVTEHKRAEDQLRVSQQQLQNVIDGAQLGYWDLSYKTGEQAVNDRWLTMLGLSRLSLIHI